MAFRPSYKYQKKEEIGTPKQNYSDEKEDERSVWKGDNSPKNSKKLTIQRNENNLRI